MKCIVCHSGKLEIVNSRKHTTEPLVWRRRKCSFCKVIFSTKESPDLDRAFYIQNSQRKTDKTPFQKSTLVGQLFIAGGHLHDHQDLFWLAETIAAKAFVKAAASQFIISSKDYRQIAFDTLQAYDTLLSANFAARNV